MSTSGGHHEHSGHSDHSDRNHRDRSHSHSETHIHSCYVFSSCVLAVEAIKANPMPLDQFERLIADTKTVDLAPGLTECLRVFEHREPQLPPLHENNELTKHFLAKKLPEITLYSYITRLARHGQPTPQGLVTCHVFIMRLFRVRRKLRCECCLHQRRSRFRTRSLF